MPEEWRKKYDYVAVPLRDYHSKRKQGESYQFIKKS